MKNYSLQCDIYSITNCDSQSIFFGFWRNTRKVVSETYFGEYCNKPISRIIKEDLEKLNPPKRI